LICFDLLVKKTDKGKNFTLNDKNDQSIDVIKKVREMKLSET